MTSPIEEITIICPKCRCTCEDCYCPSVNVQLDDVDDDYPDECSSAVCPTCKTKINLDTLVVDEKGMFDI